MTLQMVPRLRKRAPPERQAGWWTTIVVQTGLMVQFLGSAIPKQPVARDTRPPMVVMIDAALEDQESRWGRERYCMEQAPS